MGRSRGKPPHHGEGAGGCGQQIPVWIAVHQALDSLDLCDLTQCIAYVPGYYFPSRRRPRVGEVRFGKLVKRIWAAAPIEIRATCFSHALAPCVSVCRDQRWGRFWESYSEDPQGC